MQDTLRSTMRSVQNQPHDEEFDLGESSSLRGTVSMLLPLRISFLTMIARVVTMRP